VLESNETMIVPHWAPPSGFSMRTKLTKERHLPAHDQFFQW